MAELLLFYCAMLLGREMDNRQLLTLYFTLTQIVSGGKSEINLHTTLKLTLFMLISCLMRSRPIFFYERRDVYVPIIVYAIV